MTVLADLIQPDKGQPARTIHIVDKQNFDDWLAAQPERHRTAIDAQDMKPTPFARAILPGDKADDWSVVTVVADRVRLSSWCLAKLAETLPAGTYRLAEGEPGAALFGWLSAQYRFDTYRKDEKAAPARILLTGEVNRIADTVRTAKATARVRDLVNTPTLDMGPADLEAAVAALARKHDGECKVTRGDELEQGYPMIHAVGMAADKARAPRLIELSWGRKDAPRVAIVGKGVCFDTGGLDIKPSAGMRLMKKDMGGAAHALALAGLVMEHNLPVRLHLLIPAVENAIAGNALRPGDVIISRKGLSVEVANTDAEGRLILADALVRAVEDEPELLIDFATLTGAARVALGPDLPALFANDDALATDMAANGTAEDDPLWRLPLWTGYDDMLKSDVADLNNSPDGGFAGSITAALFLSRFVPDTLPWAHFDTFAWRPSAKPGRPKGGEALGLRAAWGLLRQRYG
ncbi:leucyl aminopeptidase family protein [Sphingomonas sp. C3-2]|uniref:leucyl aminopeptidase family protein n=1 Tax=Sphingomonas sp. C3-2 TaxID=3062169 RepID=UPI00294AA88B|nr:leucyl aminopeptidase family protein [Sphingomonas sp. C3-2]WOK37065.1 leucyl aminopeptidase family protein [Sphingomonas sp. C3-2]